MFQPPTVDIFREAFFEGYITQNFKTVFSFLKIYIKIQNTDKIICTELHIHMLCIW